MYLYTNTHMESYHCVAASYILKIYRVAMSVSYSCHMFVTMLHMLQP